MPQVSCLGHGWWQESHNQPSKSVDEGGRRQIPGTLPRAFAGGHALACTVLETSTLALALGLLGLRWKDALGPAEVTSGPM